MLSAAQVAENFAQVREDIEEIGGREAVDRIRIVAVTKTHPFEAALIAADVGCHGLGENYAQETIAKYAVGHPLPLHFIGHLQTNKVRQLVPMVDVWETVDRIELGLEISKRCPGATVMLQVNVSGEASKSGCKAAEAEVLLAGCRDAGLNVIGLMTMAPLAGGDGAARRSFSGLRRLADSLGLSECSMGMSSDYRIAVAEGATVLRLGSVLFGART